MPEMKENLPAAAMTL